MFPREIQVLFGREWGGRQIPTRHRHPADDSRAGSSCHDSQDRPALRL